MAVCTNGSLFFRLNSLMELLFKLFQLYVKRLIYIMTPFLHLVFYHLIQILVKVVVLVG